MIMRWWQKEGHVRVTCAFTSVNYRCQFVKPGDWNNLSVRKQCVSIKIVAKIIIVSNCPKKSVIAMCRHSYAICCIWFNFITVFHVGGKGQGQCILLKIEFLWPGWSVDFSCLRDQFSCKHHYWFWRKLKETIINWKAFLLKRQRVWLN